MHKTNKEVALEYIKHYTGQWYKWGGDDPDGFDCSGLACEFMKAGGLVSRNYDNTAQGIWDEFKAHQVRDPYEGCLVFWTDKPGGTIIHVEIMMNPVLAFGASGGGSKTLTPADAMKDNAFIKVRLAASRAHIHGYIDPWLSKN